MFDKENFKAKVMKKYENANNDKFYEMNIDEARRINIKKSSVKILATASVFVFFITGIVFAKEIKILVNNFFNNNKGLDTAIQNGYINEPKVDYIESNDTKIIVKNFLMDDFNLNFSFEINFDSNISIDNVARIRLPNLIITDDEKRILYCEDEDTLNNYNKANNCNYSMNSFNNNYINSGSNWYIKNKIKNTNTVELIYNFYANNYPKSKEIYLNFTKINLSEQEKTENKELILNGNWQIKLDVPEKFYNREALVYSVKSCSNPNLNITDATLYDTCFKFKFNTNVDPIYNESDSIEIKREKMNELNSWMVNELKDFREMVNDEYILNDYGEKFYPLRSSPEDAQVDYFPDGRFEYMQSFDLTKYNKNSNHIKVYLNLNLPTIKENIEIELERK